MFKEPSRLSVSDFGVDFDSGNFFAIDHHLVAVFARKPGQTSSLGKALLSFQLKHFHNLGLLLQLSLLSFFLLSLESQFLKYTSHVDLYVSVIRAEVIARTRLGPIPGLFSHMGCSSSLCLRVSKPAVPSSQVPAVWAIAARSLVLIHIAN